MRRAVSGETRWQSSMKLVIEKGAACLQEGNDLPVNSPAVLATEVRPRLPGNR